MINADVALITSGDVSARRLALQVRFGLNLLCAARRRRPDMPVAAWPHSIMAVMTSP
jgi:hypothetical protein